MLPTWQHTATTHSKLTATTPQQHNAVADISEEHDGGLCEVTPTSPHGCIRVVVRRGCGLSPEGVYRVLPSGDVINIRPGLRPARR